VYCAFHPNTAGEIDVIDPKNSHVRVDEYELFRSAEWNEWISRQPLQAAAMRDL
jgi:hypothetical protein